MANRQLRAASCGCFRRKKHFDDRTLLTGTSSRGLKTAFSYLAWIVMSVTRSILRICVFEEPVYRSDFFDRCAQRSLPNYDLRVPTRSSDTTNRAVAVNA